MVTQPYPASFLISSELQHPAPALANRLRRLALSIQALAAVGALVMLGLFGWACVAPAQDLLSLDALGGGHLQLLLRADFTPALRARVLGVMLLSLALGWALLWQLWRLFGQYRLGAVFSPAALLHLRRFSWLLVVHAVSRPLLQTAMTLAVSSANPPGQRALELSLGSDDYTSLLVALVFVAIARVMAEAARLAAENAEFV